MRRQMGARLREVRQAGCMTQDEVAYHLLVDRSRISRIETGAASPTFDELAQIAGLFSLSLVQLMGGIGPLPQGLWADGLVGSPGHPGT